MNADLFNKRLKELSLKKDGKRKLTPTLKTLNIDPNLPQSVFVHSPSVDVIEILAQYYDVSIDFLLGRTDEPKVNKGNSISNSGVGINIQGDNNANMQITVNKPEDNSLSLLELLNKMPEIERARLIVQIDDLYNKKNVQ